MVGMSQNIIQLSRALYYCFIFKTVSLIYYFDKCQCKSPYHCPEWAVFFTEHRHPRVSHGRVCAITPLFLRGRGYFGGGGGGTNI